MVASTVFCINCGAANQPQAKYCFSCGQMVKGSENELRIAEDTGQIKPGELLKQRYKVLGCIGQGGFGAVYKLEDSELGQRRVAAKELSQRNLTAQEIDAGVAAFKNEALM